MVERSGRPNAPLRKTGRLRRSVRIESGALDVPAAGPESRAADLVRIRFARDGIGARPLRRGSAGKARDRQIEAAPEKMHGAGLALKSGAEFLEHVVGPDQNAPEFM